MPVMKSWIYVHVSFKMLKTFIFILFATIVFFLSSFFKSLIRFRFASFWVKAIWIGWSVFNYGLIEVNRKRYTRCGEREREKKRERERVNQTHVNHMRVFNVWIYLWLLFFFSDSFFFQFLITPLLLQKKRISLDLPQLIRSDSIFLFIYLFVCLCRLNSNCHNILFHSIPFVSCWAVKIKRLNVYDLEFIFHD